MAAILPSTSGHSLRLHRTCQPAFIVLLLIALMNWGNELYMHHVLTLRKETIVSIRPSIAVSLEKIM